ncbi:hypothetical protein [Azospirillum sp. B506]|uniref:hypothetical protein n=1 Tax=Azospirillum sp. B506 TaxID=137721 RepID=UPI00131F39BC|nr:hypothetical protein [Azospirillum sp. B506]
MAALIAKLGPDFRVIELRGRVTCRECGRKAMLRRGFDGAGGYHWKNGDEP